MDTFSEEKIINQLRELKGIKPRKEWAVLLKSEILGASEAKTEIRQEAQFAGFGHTLHSIFFQRRLAYVLSALALFFVGVLGFGINTVPGDPLFPVRKLAEESTRAISGQTGIKKNVATLNSRINDLALITKEGKTENVTSAINEIKANASQLVKEIKDNPVEDPSDIKEIAKSLKTLASVTGSNASQNDEVKNLYQTVVQAQIADLEKSTLTEKQTEELKDIKDLFGQEKYSEALEKILLINN